MKTGTSMVCRFHVNMSDNKRNVAPATTVSTSTAGASTIKTSKLCVNLSRNHNKQNSVPETAASTAAATVKLPVAYTLIQAGTTIQ
jgi:hypothetical protein